MTTAQWIYAALLTIYAILFLIFSRMFYWRYYAYKNYYNRRPTNLSEGLIEELAHEQGKSVPFFSIFVPARNEADVIEKTIDHMSHLNYSPDQYEVLIVTDEKEAQAAEAERQQIVKALTPFLLDEGSWPGDDRKYDDVLMALLARLALEEAQLAERKAGPYLSVRELLMLSPHQRQEILRDISVALISGGGHIDRDRLYEAIRRSMPQTDAAEIARLYPIFLSFAIPAVMAATQLKKSEPEKLLARIMNAAAQARQPITQKVLTALSETVGSRIIRRIHATPADKLAEWLTVACLEALPTTQDIVERKRREFAGLRNVPALKHVEVPWDFDGAIGGDCTGHFVPSTKGRALNYAFGFAADQSTLWAFYDAESRPSRDTLLYVAWRKLILGDKYQIAQGPVYQIRNFWKLGPICKIAGLYQGISHEWQIPWQLRSIPLIGGTNFFATPELMLRIGGLDPTALTEDMELGVRAWLLGNAWPEFVPYPSSEQTPPTFKAFFRQRLRWGSGYLQVYDKLKADDSLPEQRKNKLLQIYWWKGHFSWTLLQLMAFLPLLVGILALNHLIDRSAAPAFVNKLPYLFTPLYLSFTLYAFFHYYEFMDVTTLTKRITSFVQIFTLPIAAFFLPLPYSSALVLKWVGRAPQGWVKTPRTRE